MFVTEETFQSPIGWLNWVVWNILTHVRYRRYIPVADELVKGRGLLNICAMKVTEETFQSLIGWLKQEAPINILAMFVTAETFQPPIGWLNALAL